MAIDKDAVELARQILNAACGSMHSVETIDLEAVVVKSIILLSMGHAVDFQDYEEPPAEFKSWLRRSDMNRVHGALMLVLRRWHELGGSSR